MRAVVCHRGELAVVDAHEPEPGEGQVLLQVAGCGICGSDLHARHHADAQADILAEAGYRGFMRADQKVVFGHEFCGTVAGYGPRTTRKIALGSAVVALPLRRADHEMHAIGLSAAAPGAYAERVVVEEAFMFPVPNGLSPDLAVVTEPLAIGRHAVRRSEITKKDAAIVIGCGPIGLAVITMLRAARIDTIVASDPSPGRRQLASACGASLTVDPADGSPYDSLSDLGFTTSISDAVRAGLAGMHKLQRLPVPPHLALRVLDALGVTKGKRPIVFECVGVPGIIDQIITNAPLATRVVVAGVCMEPDHFRPVMAINKEIDLRFVVGYGALEFRDTLHLLADGRVDASPMITGTVGLNGVASAFDVLASPTRHAKVVIDPGRTAELEAI